MTNKAVLLTSVYMKLVFSFFRIKSVEWGGGGFLSEIRCFDICDFYLSITNMLLQKALNYTSKYTDISEDQTHAKKITLYKDGNPWKKQFYF